MLEDLRIAPDRVLPKEALSLKTARASGPGGQHVNRTETKVQLTLDPRLVPWMDAGTRLRLVALSGRNVDAEGRIRVMSQEYRDKGRNLDDACEKLRELVRKALVRPKVRIATKPTKAAKRRRLEDKRHTAQKKAARRKPSDD